MEQPLVICTTGNNLSTAYNLPIDVNGIKDVEIEDLIVVTVKSSLLNCNTE
jgi:hypothetical protein